ncbi:MAG: CDP-alcohol phosphatidyltransferase family protein [Myxococcales bacterium]|nr:CDP-alcohol phosphatidyltransferase family protein [Myxococcales bacterium]
MADEKPAAHATYKPIEVEELVDVHLHRPAARALVRVIKDTPITSNQVTVLSGVFGIIAGMLIGFGDPGRLWPVALGGVALFMSVVFDCADGQLARLRGTSSLAGRALDGFIDIVPIASVFIGWALFLDHYGFNPYYSWPVATAAGLSVRWHAETYDYAKCLFLANTHPNPGGEAMPSMEEIEAERQRLIREGNRGMAFFMLLFKAYTKAQRARKQGQAGLDEPGMANAEERSLYRRLFGRAMRLWSWNGIGTHNFLLYAAAILTPVWPAAAFATFWIIILPLNALTLGLQQWGKALERRLAVELRGARGGDAA